MSSISKRLQRMARSDSRKHSAGRPGGKVGVVMSEFKRGKLHSGSKHGPRVTSRRQAVAIGLSEARKAGENVPAPKRRRRK